MFNNGSYTLNLNRVHELYACHKYHDALAILEQLAKKNPDFRLYTEKINECKKRIAASSTSDNDCNLSTLDSLPKNASDKEVLEYGVKLAKEGQISAARVVVLSLYNANPNNVEAINQLAHFDLVEGRFADALSKAKKSLAIDSLSREAYRVAEQAAIELGMHEEANAYFLSQPAIVNPVEPRKRGKNPVLPPHFKMPPLIGAGNDYTHILEQASIFKAGGKPYKKKVSVIMPVFNRHEILANTLAALTHQTYPKDLTEIIVVDDGSSDAVFDVIKKYENKLNLYFARQADKGYRLAAARNLALRCSTGESVIFMDADILPLPEDIENYMTVLHVTDNAVLIGHRRYADVSNINDDQILVDIKTATDLPNITPDNDVAGMKDATGASIDWRFPVYAKTDYLKKDMWPFTKAAGGNIAFSRALLERGGFVDEEFTAWGCEDGEHCYRLYNAGAYFIPLLNIVSIHQEPLNKPEVSVEELNGESFRSAGQRITREIFSKKCPAPTVRTYKPGSTFTVPKVSIYIPAFNVEDYIVDAINSCLTQNYDDLEVCICDDGSTDNTIKVIQENFSNNPNVRWVTQQNGGIGKATNTALKMCRGMYIGQLDSDDILKPHAVRRCVEVLDRLDVDAVYGDCEYIDSQGKYIRDSWCGGEFSREWMLHGMIATSFRMFRRRLWERTSGCNETIKNAVDLDLWLKFNEVGRIHHIHEILYSYRWHGKNTSIVHRKQQESNHLRVIADSLKRMGLSRFWSVESTNNRLNPREFKIVPLTVMPPVEPKDVIFLIPTCLKYAEKADAIRNTWAQSLGKLNFRYFFLMGRPESTVAVVEADTLYVPCKDDYESLLLKLILGYQFLYCNFEFTHIYKIDDDCFPNLSKLTSEILPQLAGYQYVGGATHPKGAKINPNWHIGKCSDARFDKPYPSDVAPFEFAKGGYGYFLRRDAVPHLFEMIQTLRAELSDGIYSYEDLRISEILNFVGISANKISGYSVITEKADALEDNMLMYDITNPKKFFELARRPCL